MKASLLIPETPMVILPTLAERIGLNEALFLQQLHYWISKSNHLHEGKRWVYNSYEGWQKHFPFWSVATIKRIVASLKNKGLIEIKNFNSLKLDRTNWYTINYNHKALQLPSYEISRPSYEISRPLAQFDPTIGSICTNHWLNLHQPIPENTTENTTKEKEKDISNDISCSTFQVEPSVGVDGLSSSSQNSKKPKQNPVPYKKIQELWNNTVQENQSVLPLLHAINPNTTRGRHVAARWKQFPNLETWETVFQNAATSSFLNGNNSRGFLGKFDWIVKTEDNFTKVLEGNYNSGVATSNSSEKVVGEFDYAAFARDDNKEIQIAYWINRGYLVKDVPKDVMVGVRKWLAKAKKGADLEKIINEQAKARRERAKMQKEKGVQGCGFDVAEALFGPGVNGREFRN